MANRCQAPNLFAGLSPTWILSNLDQNSAFFQGSFQDASLGYVNGIPADTGTANAYVVTLPFGSPSSYQAGMTVVFTPTNTNTGPSTITVNPLGSSAILNPAGLALSGGEIAANRRVMLVSDGASFYIVGPCPYSKVFASNTSNQTVDVAGYTSVVINVGQTGGSCGLTLSHLGVGIPVTVTLQNGTGASISFFIGGTTPAGVAIQSFAILAGGLGAFTLVSSAFSIAGNTARVFTSAGMLGGQLFFS
jgi:hypothetical protein